MVPLFCRRKFGFLGSQVCIGWVGGRWWGAFRFLCLWGCFDVFVVVRQLPRMTDMFVADLTMLVLRAPVSWPGYGSRCGGAALPTVLRGCLPAYRGAVVLFHACRNLAGLHCDGGRRWSGPLQLVGFFTLASGGCFCAQFYLA